MVVPCFLFYAILSIYFIITGKYKDSEDRKKRYYILKGLVSANITLTMIIYTILELTNSVSAYDGHFIECLFVHYITPIMIILDYFMFDKKGEFKWYYPIIWSCVPVAYGAFSFVYTILGGTFVEGKYAYEFYNVERFGIGGVAINCIMIYVGFMAINYLVVYYDKKVGEKK